MQEGFTYDPEGQLASTTTAGDNAGTTSFAYDASGNRVATTNPDGSTVSQVFDGSDPVQQTDTPVAEPATTSDYLYGADGIAELTASGSSGSSADYYGADGLGSITDLTDASGDVASQYEYDAYGENLGASGSGSVQQPFGYLGNETDPTTTQATNISSSLDDFNAREYDPSLGQFLSPDPISGSTSAPDTLDAYAYGGDNPFSNPDPTGMCFLGIGHGCPISDALDSIQNAGNWLYDHPLATAGIAVGGVALDAAALVCAAGPCELAGAVAGAAALVDAEATGVAADVAATGAEGLADAGVEGAADTVEGVGAPTFEDASAEDYTYTINTTYDEDSGTYALSWSGQEASSTQAEIGVADDNWYNATVDMADWTDPVRLPIPAGVKGIGAAVAVWALGADLYDELKNH